MIISIIICFRQFCRTIYYTAQRYAITLASTHQSQISKRIKCSLRSSRICIVFPSILVTILISSPSHFPCFGILCITFMNNLRHGNSKVTIIGIKFSYQRIFIGYFRIFSPTIDIVSLTILFSLNTNIKCLISIIIPPTITTFGRRKKNKELVEATCHSPR